MQPPPGQGYQKKIYGSDLTSGIYQVSDSPPSELDPSATFDIVLKHPKMGQPTHVQVHIDHASKMKTDTFVKFLASLNNGDDLTTAKASLDDLNKYHGGIQYAKPTITKKLNYTKFQKTIGGGKTEGNAVKVVNLKVGDTFLIPADWDPDNQGQIATVSKKWTKSNGYLRYVVTTGENAGTNKQRHIGYYQTEHTVIFGQARSRRPAAEARSADRGRSRQGRRQDRGSCRDDWDVRRNVHGRWRPVQVGHPAGRDGHGSRARRRHQG